MSENASKQTDHSTADQLRRYFDCPEIPDTVRTLLLDLLLDQVPNPDPASTREYIKRQIMGHIGDLPESSRNPLLDRLFGVGIKAESGELSVKDP